MKHHFPVPFIKTFQRCFAIHHSDYYIAVLCRVLLSDYDEIAVLDSDVNHTVAVRMKNKQVPTAENRSRKRNAFFYLLHRVNRLSARDRTDDRRDCHSARFQLRQHIYIAEPCPLYPAAVFKRKDIRSYKVKRTHIDGKDNISCIDLDHCYDENGQPSALAKEVLSKCGKTYVEKSVSGNGLHIFGKTGGMDIRTFSKDGDLEFYQKEHFIAMTGDGSGYSRLESFDTPEMKELLSRKCEKREEWKGVCKGVNGLSTMTDRDVVEKASNAKNGDKFKRLYAGEDLQNNHSNSDMSLMNLLAYWCNGDKEQMLRIFATSGLFRPNKSPDYYEGTAIKALRSMPVKSTYTPTVPKNTGGNGKR